MTLLFLVCLTTIIIVINGTNYYISSSSGIDSNNGTSMNSPWKTFINLQNLKIYPNDQILLKSNDEFNQQLFVKDIHGTQLSPVTITTYTTTTNTPFHRAIINQQHNNSTNSTILCSNCQGIVISYWVLSHSHFGIALIYDNPSSNNVYNVTIKNNYFHNLIGNGLPNTSEWWGAAIITGQNTKKNGNDFVNIYNLNIINNLCNESDTFFKFNGYAHYGAKIMSGVINGNTLTYNYYNIVPLGNLMYNFSIVNNIFLYNYPIKEFDRGTTDIIIVTSDDENNKSSIINNEFGYRGEWNGSNDGCSMDFERNAFGTNVFDNYIHHSFAAGIMIYGHPNDNDELSQDLYIHNNIFIQDGCYQKSNDHGAMAFMWPNTSGIVQNCIFIKCQNNLSVPIFWDKNNPQNLETWKFINNTVYNTTDMIVDDVIVDYVINGDVVNVMAKCGKNVENDCDIRYSLDGSKPTIDSMKYDDGQVLSVNVTTAVFFKAFKEGMIESAAVGKIIGI